MIICYKYFAMSTYITRCKNPTGLAVFKALDKSLKKAAEQLVHAFVTSTIDCCNALLYGLPKGQLQKIATCAECRCRSSHQYKKICTYHTSLEKSPLASCRTAFDVQNSSDHLSGIVSSHHHNTSTHSLRFTSHRVLVSGHLVNFPWPSQKLNGHGGIESLHQQLLTCGIVFPNQFTYLSLLTFSRAN